MTSAGWIRALFVTGALAVTGPAAAESDMDRLIDHLDLAETIAVLREEGMRHGAEIAREMLPGAAEDRWNAILARIYDTGKMLPLVVGRFSAELEETDLDPLLAFFGSRAGQEIIAQELNTRRAFLDPRVEMAAHESYRAMHGQGARLPAQIDRLIADSDLVGMNVAGALNANLMFYRGLADGGAYEMDEADILADVWSQEAEIRSDTADWLHAFLTAAYRPVDPDRLAAYAALYRTPEGRDLNRAIFAAFDEMYDEISYLMGRAVARYLQSERL